MGLDVKVSSRFPRFPWLWRHWGSEKFSRHLHPFSQDLGNSLHIIKQTLLFGVTNMCLDHMTCLRAFALVVPLLWLLFPRCISLRKWHLLTKTIPHHSMLPWLYFADNQIPITYLFVNRQSLGEKQGHLAELLQSTERRDHLYWFGWGGDAETSRASSGGKLSVFLGLKTAGNGRLVSEPGWHPSRGLSGGSQKHVAKAGREGEKTLQFFALLLPSNL